MYDILILLLSGTIILIGFFISIGVDHPKPLFISSIVPFFLFIWIYISSLEPWEYTVDTFTVQTISNIDVIVVEDSRIINVNSLFGRDFEQGELIIRKTGIDKAYKGIRPSNREVLYLENKEENRD